MLLITIVCGILGSKTERQNMSTANEEPSLKGSICQQPQFGSKCKPRSRMCSVQGWQLRISPAREDVRDESGLQFKLQCNSKDQNNSILVVIHTFFDTSSNQLPFYKRPSTKIKVLIISARKHIIVCSHIPPRPALKTQSDVTARCLGTWGLKNF